MKTCFKCKRGLPEDEFYRHPQMGDGHLGKCKDCTKRDVRERYRVARDQRREYERKRFKMPERKAKLRQYIKGSRVRNPQKWAARAAVAYALRNGKIERKPCEVCGSTDQVQAHHLDYSKPLDVRWLCFKHHREAHGQQVS